MMKQHKDKRQYKSYKVKIYFVLEIIAIILIANILIHLFPKWLVVSLAVIYLILGPYNRFITKLDEIRIKTRKR